MTTENRQPPMLDGCEVLPPMTPTEPTEPTADQSKLDRRSSRQKTGNRFAVLNAFVDTAAGELTRSEILVWLVLYRDTRNGIAETSQAHIASRARISPRTVRYAINRLIKRGLLTLVYRGGLNRGASKYRVLCELGGRPLRQ